MQYLLPNIAQYFILLLGYTEITFTIAETLSTPFRRYQSCVIAALIQWPSLALALDGFQDCNVACVHHHCCCCLVPKLENINHIYVIVKPSLKILGVQSTLAPPEDAFAIVGIIDFCALAVSRHKMCWHHGWWCSGQTG